MGRSRSSHDPGLEGGLWSKLSKTRNLLSDGLNTILGGKRSIDTSLLEELEELLFTADMGVEITEQLVEGLRELIDRKSLEGPEQVKAALREEVISILEGSQGGSRLSSLEGEHPGIPEVCMFVGVNGVGKTTTIAKMAHYYQSQGDSRLSSLEGERPGIPEVCMFVGINGVGKTTTIAKMAHYYQSQGESVMLVAGDTFRAAAIEQLQVWGDRLGAEVLSQKRGADPAAVVFDALSAAKARDTDKVLIDTAGRLHTKSNLMEELKKIQRIAGQQVSGAPHRVILILDATTGQNAIAQSQVFAQSLGVTDIILAKLDGTAKGGVVVGISQGLSIPISFIGTGEGLEDLEIFNPREFAEAIFD